MKVLILSAGQGRRLLPLTASIPKCAVPIRGRSILEWQLEELARCGVDRVTVVVGFAAEHVDRLLNARAWPYEVRTLYNPFFAVADNLASCWVAAPEMTEDFVLVNGDTLFEAAVLRRLLAAPPRPVTLAVAHKAAYLTPVPGGVGPMTVVSLMQNLVDAARCAAGLTKAQYRL